MKKLKSVITTAARILITELRAFLAPLLWFGAGLLGIPASVIGVVHAFIYHLYKKRLWSAVVNLVSMCWEVCKSVTLILGYVGYAMDMLCNVTVGRIVKIWCTDMPLEKTWFGRSGITLSASIGHVQSVHKLKTKGQWISNALDLAEVNRKNHCKKAYLVERYRMAVRLKY